jgi:D-glycero-D-manno-heptose 1,7-bisphosphate phosphatase
LDLSRTLFIGDDERDAQAAEAAGSPFMLVSEKKGLLEIVRELTAAPAR